MSLKDVLNTHLKEALKAGDEARKTVLRGVMAAIRRAELAQRATQARALGPAATDEQLKALDAQALPDEVVLNVLQEEAKSRRESIADAEKAGRADLVEVYRIQLAVLEGYLPRALTRDEIVALAKAAIATAGVTNAKDIGAVMKLLTPQTKDRADGKLVYAVVRELLN
jgi:hypothetical protein